MVADHFACLSVKVSPRPADMLNGMGLSPLVFTGVSRFSSDLNTILTRAVTIASIPIQELQNEQSDVLVKKQLLSDLRNVVATLGTTVSTLGSIGANRSVTASSSNAVKVGVTNTGATQTGVYTLSDITSLAKAASETSTSGYATADATSVDADGSLQLVVGSNTYTITLTAAQNNLNGLRDAINALGAGVTAAVLNTGTGATPHYLSVTATATGVKTLQVRGTAGDAASNIVTSTNQGADAVFKLNGISVTKSDNVVTGVIPGLTFTLLGTTAASETVTLNLTSDRSTLATELQNLVTNYNKVVDKINAQTGKTAGLLSGDFVVRHLQSQMRALTSYQGTGAIKALADLGIELDKTGKMSFNSPKFYSISNSDMDTGYLFLGSTTTGLGALASNFTQISDPVSGIIKTQQNQYDTADTRITKQIDAIKARIDYMKSSLASKLQQADALLAGLSSQQTLLAASLEGVNLLLFGKKQN